MINDNNYITIQGWMRNNLGLVGNELIVYAAIYGFVQDDEENYHPCSFSYLADWCGQTPITMKRTIKKLIERGVIKKNQVMFRGKITNAYSTTLASPTGIKMIQEKMIPVSKCTKYQYQNDTSTGIKMIHNNTNIIQDNNNNIESGTQTTEKARWVKPTINEIEAYISKKNLSVDARKFFLYYESNGWMVGRTHMKSWTATLARWSMMETKRNTSSNGYRNNDEREQRIADTRQWLSESVANAERKRASNAPPSSDGKSDDCPF